MGRSLTQPGNRLVAAAQLAAADFFDGENTKHFALDVGCDHAKLAIYLVQSGICERVLALDINDGPVKKAAENVARRKLLTEPLDKYITVIKNDGLCGLEEYGAESADRIFILGMGGELIADILERAAFVKDVGARRVFILQAMTSESDLRKYLYENGFDIKREKLVLDKGRIYSVIAAVYDGEKRKAEPYIYEAGDTEKMDADELLDSYLARKIRILEKLISQRKDAGLGYDEQSELLENIKRAKSTLSAV